ncbi:MAG: helix-hairpin-helix domain-containing protein [Proteobacteria bacterium]|nr:helix-hairpin-helix domain-containing protein [Pseudomonadota bacterium]
MVRIVRTFLRPALLLVLSSAAGWMPAAAQTRTAPAAPAASLIDLNTASRDDLMNLEGIGEVRADAIIRSRPFRAKTELVERHIIPESLYEKISDKVMARPVPTAPATPARPAQGQPRR